VDQINESLGKKGRLDYDGRPIFGFSCVELVDMMNSISKDIEIIPAHAWTPWFSIFGSNSGFNSIEECFLDRAKYIHAFETGLSCYDLKTEVLTNKGWKRIFDVKSSDEICTLNLKKDEIEFQCPIKSFKYKYKGKMYRLKTNRIDLLVTPNHKLLYSHCDFRKKPIFSLKEAEILFNKSKRFKKDGIWNGKNKKYFLLPLVKIKHGSRYYSGFRNKQKKMFLMKSWLKFFGFWIAEGWTSEGKNGEYAVCLANKNSNLLLEMKKILEGFGYNVYQNNDILRVRDYQLFSYLKQFGKSHEKFIPKEIKELSKDLLETFFDYYIQGDGHRYGRNNKGLSATTISENLRDDLQEIALKIGISAYYKIHNKKGTPIISLPHAKLKGYKQSRDSWVIYFIRKNIHTTMPSTIKKYNHIESWVYYNGFVYCLEVPNHVIYIRRNGIPVWCGNSDPAMNWRISKLDNYTIVSFSDLHSFWPWRLGREATIFDINLNYKNLINAIRTRNGLKETIEVDPSYGKYHYDGHRMCNVCLSPDESLKLKDICPKCGRKLTIGVAHRVDELADRDVNYKPKNAIPFKTIIPLSELLSVYYNQDINTKLIWNVYNKIIEKHSEFDVLLDLDYEKLKEIMDTKLINVILQNREGKIKVKPGYDGVYGEPQLEVRYDKKQKSLMDF
ncbi:MAG: LAGLIDADG family homing endonuclease, partial [Candidatus Woesearchaeota archaeon]